MYMFCNITPCGPQKTSPTGSVRPLQRQASLLWEHVQLQIHHLAPRSVAVRLGCCQLDCPPQSLYPHAQRLRWGSSSHYSLICFCFALICTFSNCRCQFWNENKKWQLLGTAGVFSISWLQQCFIWVEEQDWRSVLIPKLLWGNACLSRLKSN